MTDILTRLAAITKNGPAGTTPRPWSVGAQNPMAGEVNVHRKYRDPSFTTTGGRGIRVVATLGNKLRRELDDEARANAELIVASMNREAALIALVQEAAGEIERLRIRWLTVATWSKYPALGKPSFPARETLTTAARDHIMDRWSCGCQSYHSGHSIHKILLDFF